MVGSLAEKVVGDTTVVVAVIGNVTGKLKTGCWKETTSRKGPPRQWAAG